MREPSNNEKYEKTDFKCNYYFIFLNLVYAQTSEIHEQNIDFEQIENNYFTKWESPVIIFVNKSNKEYLLAYQYEGNTENAYSCFEMGYFEDDKNISLEKSNKTDETSFQTESGLSLGLSLEEVIRIKGQEYEQQKSGDYIVLNYRIENYENSPFLREYNMPSYFIEIKLENSIVKKIIFGFDYP